MSAAAGIQHETFQHGVFGITGDFNPMPAQHMQVVLAVLSDLMLAGIGEQGRQRGQRCLAIQLLRCARIFVGQRDIHGLARLRGETQANQVGLHGIKAVGFGVEGECRALLQRRDQRFKLRQGEDGFVFARG